MNWCESCQMEMHTLTVIVRCVSCKERNGEKKGTIRKVVITTVDWGKREMNLELSNSRVA